MDGSVTAGEQCDYAQRLIAAGKRLHARADGTQYSVIDGEVTVSAALVYPKVTVEPCVAQAPADRRGDGGGGLVMQLGND